MRVLSRLIPLCLSLSYLTKIGGCQDYKECTAILQPQANGDKTGRGGVPLVFWMFRLTFGTEWRTQLHLCATWEGCLCSWSHIGVGRGKVGISDKNTATAGATCMKRGMSETNSDIYLFSLSLSWKVKYMRWWHHRFISTHHGITALILGLEWEWLYVSLVLEVGKVSCCWYLDVFYFCLTCARDYFCRFSSTDAVT